MIRSIFSKDSLAAYCSMTGGGDRSAGYQVSQVRSGWDSARGVAVGGNWTEQAIKEVKYEGLHQLILVVPMTHAL